MSLQKLQSIRVMLSRHEIKSSGLRWSEVKQPSGSGAPALTSLPCLTYAPYLGEAHTIVAGLIVDVKIATFRCRRSSIPTAPYYI